MFQNACFKMTVALPARMPCASTQGMARRLKPNAFKDSFEARPGRGEGRFRKPASSGIQRGADFSPRFRATGERHRPGAACRGGGKRVGLAQVREQTAALCLIFSVGDDLLGMEQREERTPGVLALLATTALSGCN